MQRFSWGEILVNTRLHSMVNPFGAELFIIGASFREWRQCKGPTSRGLVVVSISIFNSNRCFRSNARMSSQSSARNVMMRQEKVRCEVLEATRGYTCSWYDFVPGNSTAPVGGKGESFNCSKIRSLGSWMLDWKQIGCHVSLPYPFLEWACDRVNAKLNLYETPLCAELLYGVGIINHSTKKRGWK